MDTDEEIYHASPQTKGKLSHATIDEKKTSNRKDEIESLPVISLRLGIMGKIDIYRSNEKILIERKYNLKTIYRGQLYQLWAQYFCMKEMGYEVERLAFYEISTNKTTPVELPTKEDRAELEKFIEDFRNLKADILIGTQMIAKGHDFPNVTLVGVVLADVGLTFPSFKSNERTFQLITQA